MRDEIVHFFFRKITSHRWKGVTSNVIAVLCRFDRERRENAMCARALGLILQYFTANKLIG